MESNEELKRNWKETEENNERKWEQRWKTWKVHEED